MQCGSTATRTIRRVKGWMVSDDYDGASENDARTATYRQLVWYAKQKGYKPGWAGRKFFNIYGVWPNGEATPQPPSDLLEPPSTLLMHWINVQNAAYAAAKRRERIGKGNES
jgi:hypothetical protein